MTIGCGFSWVSFVFSHKDLITIQGNACMLFTRFKHGLFFFFFWRSVLFLIRDKRVTCSHRYSKTYMTRTPMARLPCLIRNRF